MDLIDKVLLIYDIPIISDIQRIIYNLFIQEIKSSNLFALHHQGKLFERLRCVTNIINLENDINDAIMFGLDVCSTRIINGLNMNYIMMLMQRKLNASYNTIAHSTNDKNDYIFLHVTTFNEYKINTN